MLEDTMTHIIDFPELHDQGFFFRQHESLGLMACFAGRACMLAGMTPVMVSLREPVETYDGVFAYALGAGVMDRGVRRNVFDAAQDVLGITDVQAADLFHWSRTIDYLRNAVKNISNTTVLA